MKHNQFDCTGIIEGKEYFYKYEDGKHYLNSRSFDNTIELIQALGAFESKSDDSSVNDKITGEFALVIKEKTILNSDNLESFLDALPNALELEGKDLEICKDFGPLAYAYISQEFSE